MPSARSATSTARSSSARSSAAAARAESRAQRTSPAAGAAPRRVALRSPVTRARWERLGRVALLVVLLAVVVVYGEHALSYLSTRSANDRQQATVRRLERQHAALLARERSLRQPSTIMREARGLGMTRPGEQPYAVTGQAGR